MSFSLSGFGHVVVTVADDVDPSLAPDLAAAKLGEAAEKAAQEKLREIAIDLTVVVRKHLAHFAGATIGGNGLSVDLVAWAKEAPALVDKAVDNVEKSAETLGEGVGSELERKIESCGADAVRDAKDAVDAIEHRLSGAEAEVKADLGLDAPKPAVGGPVTSAAPVIVAESGTETVVPAQPAAAPETEATAPVVADAPAADTWTDAPAPVDPTVTAPAAPDGGTPEGVSTSVDNVVGGAPAPQ